MFLVTPFYPLLKNMICLCSLLLCLYKSNDLMPFFSQIMLVGFVFILCILSTGSIEWLGISQHRYTWLQTIDCYSARRDGFSFEQSRFCHQYLDLMPHIHATSREVISICMSIFSQHRWNCSSLLFAPNFPTELRIGTVEQAFVQALTSALLMHKFSRICALNQSVRCSCELNKDSSDRIHRRNGCSDNIDFGLKFSQMFIEATYRGQKYNLIQRRKFQYRSFEYTSFTTAITRHNNALGRQLVLDNHKRQCKCSGLSGSCTIRTCWQAIVSPEILARQLKRRYQHAIEVAPNFLDDDLIHPQFLPISHRRIRRIHSNDLLYWARSPDYCHNENSLFSTHGRRCNNSLINPTEGSCAYLCCGRGYTTKRYIQQKQCHCHYVHCCYIQCDTCFEQIEENICQ